MTILSQELVAAMLLASSNSHACIDTSIMYPVDGGSAAVYFVTTPLRGSTSLRVYLRSRGRWQTTVEQPLICFRMTFWRESVSIRPWTISTYATSPWFLPARETCAAAAKFGSENSANGKPLNQFNWGQATLFFLFKLAQTSYKRLDCKRRRSPRCNKHT